MNISFYIFLFNQKKNISFLRIMRDKVPAHFLLSSLTSWFNTAAGWQIRNFHDKGAACGRHVGWQRSACRKVHSAGLILERTRHVLNRQPEISRQKRGIFSISSAVRASVLYADTNLAYEASSPSLSFPFSTVRARKLFVLTVGGTWLYMRELETASREWRFTGDYEFFGSTTPFPRFCLHGAKRRLRRRTLPYSKF